ncbi:MAG: recombination protein RecR [Alphaproteobacteria bacterium]|nr:recombination protein RecR [Alphaproteobacteria bacterium]
MSEGPLDHLIRLLAGLPGLGNRSARRIALHLLERRETLMLPLARGLEHAATEIKDCDVCGNLDSVSPCRVCCDPARDAAKICVVAHVSDVWAVERTGAYRGRYHVLGGLLSALDGVGPADLRIEALFSRLKAPSAYAAANDSKISEDVQHIEEVILALSATVDGQSTAHYIADHLQDFPIKVTRLAHGVPVGGELDYLDDGTIVTALNSRSAA